MAKNTGDGYRRGQVSDRYQQYNETTELFDKYDGDANHVGSGQSSAPFKGVEQCHPNKAREHSRGHECLCRKLRMCGRASGPRGSCI